MAPEGGHLSSHFKRICQRNSGKRQYSVFFLMLHMPSLLYTDVAKMASLIFEYSKNACRRYLNAMFV